MAASFHWPTFVQVIWVNSHNGFAIDDKTMNIILVIHFYSVNQSTGIYTVGLTTHAAYSLLTM